MTSAVNIGYKCSGRGVCLASGKCECSVGWAGPGCETRLVVAAVPVAAVMEEGQRLRRGGAAGCPQSCCGNGLCESGVCVCNDGWFGLACAVNHTVSGESGAPSLLSRLLRFTQASAAPREVAAVCPASSQEDRGPSRGFAPGDVSAAGAPLPIAKESDHIGFVHSQRSNRPANPFANSQGAEGEHFRKPENRDFGIHNVNEAAGHTGSIESNCPDNCNFRGICQDGICYCQTSYNGKSCGAKMLSQAGTWGVWATVRAAGGAMAVSFCVASVLCILHKRNKAAREARIGYTI